MVSNINARIPQPKVPFIGQGGMVSREWLYFLMSMLSRTGGDVGISSEAMQQQIISLFVEQALDEAPVSPQQQIISLSVEQAMSDVPDPPPPSALTFATIAGLRLNTASVGDLKPSYVEGYYAEADGGGGVFVRAVSDTTSADNGGTIIVDAAAQRWYREVGTGFINGLAFGLSAAASDNSAAFAQLEASDFSIVYLPDGNFQLAQPKGSLGKCYTGPGSIQYELNVVEGATPHSIERTRSNPLAWPGAMERGVRSVAFIGDSITAASTTGYTNGYLYLLNQKLGAALNRPVASQIPTADFDEFGFAGSFTIGTTGPVSRSYILAPGSRMDFSADFVDFVGFYYAQNASTAGVITITDNFSGIVEVVTTTTGVNLNQFAGTLPNRRCGAGVTFSLACSVSPVELNGLFCSHATLSQGLLLQELAYPGYTTVNFSSTQALEALVAQIYYPTQPIIVIALGTNDIFSPTFAITPTQYIENLDTMCTYFLTHLVDATIILTVPLMPYSGSPTVFAPFGVYRSALYDFARRKGLDVVDLSELDMDTNPAVLYSDNLHPSDLGMEQISSYWFEKLHWEVIRLGPYTAPMTVGAGFSHAAAYEAVQTTLVGSQVFLGGVLATPAIAPALPVTIATVEPLSAAPSAAKLFACPTAAPAGVAIVALQPGGAMQLVSYTAASWPVQISFGGISYGQTS